VSRSRGTHLRRRPPAPAENSVEVGGAKFEWELRHAWGATPDGDYRGISVSVWAQRHQTRELILDFPFRLFGIQPPEPEKLEEAIQQAIPLAIDFGWKPETRGRRVRFEVPEGES
jgi:hypothetical protein